MELDSVFARKVLEGGRHGWQHARKCGITAEMLSGDGRKAIDWALVYEREHGAFPSIELTEVSLGLALDSSDAALGYCENEVLNRALYLVIRDKVRSIGELVDQRKPREAFSAMLACIDEGRKIGLTETRMESLLSYGEKVIEAYFKAKAGERGIPTPWPTINEMMGGLVDGTLNGIVGRPGTGKTFMLMLMALHAWRKGKKVLIVGTEMTNLQMAYRFYACQLHLSYKPFTRGKLGEFVEAKMVERIRQLSANDQDRLRIVGGDFDMTTEGLDEVAGDFDPDAVFIDGLYLLKPGKGDGKGRSDRHSRVSDVFEEVKKGAKRRNKPYVYTMQFNRDMKAGDKTTASLDNVGTTDVAGWTSDNVLGMFQDKDMKDGKKMGIKGLKFREGDGDEIILRWDFDSMDFSEEGRSEEYQDDDFEGTQKAAMAAKDAPPPVPREPGSDDDREEEVF